MRVENSTSGRAPARGTIWDGRDGRPMSRDPILRAFDALTARDPGAPLVVSPTRRATVGDVDALAHALTARLAGTLPPGRLVALAAGNGPGMLAALVALRRAGLAALLLDWRSPEAERLRTARALGAAALLACRTCWPGGPEDWSVTALGAVSALGGDGLELPETPEDIAVVKLTSGSTGAPRGIATPAEALIADDAALAAAMGLRPDDRLLAAVPMSHSYGLSSLAMPALVRGTVLVLPDEAGVFGPFAAAASTGATVFPTSPAWVHALLGLSEPPPWPTSLRLVVTAGAPLAPAAAARFREAFGRPVHVFYGASECGGICYDREGGAGERGTVGTPVDGVRVELAPVAGGVPDQGAVTVKSAAVAAGYLPAEPGGSLAPGRFTTGDLATWKGGELELLARLDDLVNVRGKKVNPREVEEVIAGLPGVDEVAALAVGSPAGGEVLRAVVACRSGRLAYEEVMAHCRAHLAAHKVPRSLILVPALPRTERGKLDRHALAALEPTGGGRRAPARDPRDDG